ncbi:MAG: NAD(P)/FAD-dependent oxidoreductase [Phenylobacterium sp.]|uniref:NAD(P)/FAD-dependent oxidoreductase n=1 Tax=Phenylobacterium sp. TaxID=1871053 RepID=UPI00391A6854
MATDEAGRPRVVVLGAGFGGMEAVRALARAPAEVILVDRRNHHLFQPLLYQVATAALSPAEIAWPIRHVFRREKNIRVVMARALSVDLAARRVKTTGGEVAYDQLIVATGAAHSYFGKPEWEAFAPGLKTLEDATAIRRRVLSAFEKAECAPVGEQARLLTFVIVGGGPTGVEMAGAVAELARDALKRDFRRIDPRFARVLLLEAGPRILPTFPEHLAAYAQRVLQAMQVEVRTGAKVIDCDANGVALEDGRIEAETLIWAAGVAASEVAAELPCEHDRAGRAKVTPDLSLPGHPEVFVIGDAAAVTDAKGAPVPGIAPAAKQQGKYVARVIRARLEGRSAPPPFRYRHAGDLATIGRSAAIVKFDRLTLKGFVGWVFWSIAHVYFLIGLRNRIVVALEWSWSWITRQRAARLIVAEGPPPSGL